ncbi:uncharacterized protein [Elaeis guineensis]|uniref:Uncharacterized protein LOC109506446 n=1 Tax=Elaeis guineensis var. tenera TaxID=51953 RepID=A0A6J0PPP9_ELAGV|nr:uncharacterized protein LOC109506446 [Elaeis guineensis]
MMEELELRQDQLRRWTKVRHQQAFDEIKSLIVGLSLQNMERVGERPVEEEERENRDGRIKRGWSHSTKLEFSRFDGEGLKGWLLRADYFFEVAGVPVDERVKIAALHLEGKALQRHQGFIKIKGNVAYEDWETYVVALIARFGSNAFEDLLADLWNLK